MIRSLLLLLALTAPAFADDLEKDLRDFQSNAAGIIEKIEATGLGASNATSGAAEHLDVARRKLMALASDKQFLNAMNALWTSPDRNLLLICQGVFLLVMILLRAWRQAKAANWFTRLLVGFAFTILIWIGIAGVIPAIVLGEPYRVFVSTLWRVLTSA